MHLRNLPRTMSNHWRSKIRPACLKLFLLCLGVFAGCQPRVGPARSTLTIAAASDLKFAVDEFLEEYRQDHPGVEVKVSYGSSGNFHAQIRHGAPYDLYLSADIEYPRKLAREGLALDGEVFSYAIGRIVVWVPAASPIDVEMLGISALEHPSVKRIAIAHPDHAPYGRAAMAALESLGLEDAARPKLVLGENIAQAAQFVESGAADIGVLALSLAGAPQMKDKGRYWEIPIRAYPAMEQGGMILAGSKNPAAARQWRDRLLGQGGRQLLERHGFSLPQAEVTR
jgi:molybdate transport system substrate-binding protein